MALEGADFLFLEGIAPKGRLRRQLNCSLFLKDSKYFQPRRILGSTNGLVMVFCKSLDKTSLGDDAISNILDLISTKGAP